MKKFALCFLYLLTFTSALIAQDIVGFWKTYDEKTGSPQIIVAIYEYDNKYYGRVIGSYDKNGDMEDSIYKPSNRTTSLVGDPYYSGLDIIWGLEKRGSKYAGGEILDPKRGKVYDVEMWVRDSNLIVRGKLLFFGKNLTWYPAYDTDFPDGFVKPDLTKLVPDIPQIK